MAILNELKKDAVENESLTTLKNYYDALVLDIATANAHIVRVSNEVNDSHPRKKETLDACNKKLEELTSELKIVKARYSLCAFDRVVQANI
jgi:hypothetical protein